MNNEILKEVSTRVSQANNVLVAVSSNPSVDALSAAVGLTLLLNKLGKHATTVFSGVVPSTIEFLQPEQAIEKTTDSLRDFIIALDKSKADKLRYKVEDDVVRIFITPYKTTITDADLEFSLGEFNVDVVIAIGISRQDDVDQAVTAHGRILHDAAVVALTNKEPSDFGAVNWNEPQSSSLSEMVAAVAYQLSAEKIDGQMATALLTGIIAETDRFRNESTTPQSLDFASRLMRAGANQQLIADELEAAVKLQNTTEMSAPEELPMPHDAYDVPKPLDHKEEDDDGSLQIDHPEETADSDVENIHIDPHGNLSTGGASEETTEAPSAEPPSDEESHRTSTYLQPDESNQPEQNEESTFNLEAPEHSEEYNQPTLTHGKTINPISEPEYPATPSEPFDAQKAIQAMQAEQPQPMSQDANQGEPQPIEMPAPQNDLPHESTSAQEAPAPVFEENNTGEEQEQSSSQEPHEQTLEELEEAVHGPDQVSSSIPQPLETAPEPNPAPEQAPQPQPEQAPQQNIDLSSVPKPLTEDDQNGDAPPPVPPPMQPQFFDNNSSSTPGQ